MYSQLVYSFFFSNFFPSGVPHSCIDTPTPDTYMRYIHIRDTGHVYIITDLFRNFSPTIAPYCTPYTDLPTFSDANHVPTLYKSNHVKPSSRNAQFCVIVRLSTTSINDRDAMQVNWPLFSDAIYLYIFPFVVYFPPNPHTSTDTTRSLSTAISGILLTSPSLSTLPHHPLWCVDSTRLHFNPTPQTFVIIS